MNIANKIMNFINDERGGEGIEYTLIVFVIAGGAAIGIMLLKVATQAKTTDLTDSVIMIDIS
jgi:Flp pilus assembly pilin Flp